MKYYLKGYLAAYRKKCVAGVCTLQIVVCMISRASSLPTESDLEVGVLMVSVIGQCWLSTETTSRSSGITELPTRDSQMGDIDIRFTTDTWITITRPPSPGRKIV